MDSHYVDQVVNSLHVFLLLWKVKGLPSHCWNYTYISYLLMLDSLSLSLSLSLPFTPTPTHNLSTARSTSTSPEADTQSAEMEAGFTEVAQKHKKSRRKATKDSSTSLGKSSEDAQDQTSEGAEEHEEWVVL